MAGKAVLKKPAVRALVESSHKRTYPPGHDIVCAGDAPRKLYLILQGSVCVIVEDDGGREMVLAYLGVGEFFGEMCLFPEQQVRTAIVRARQPTLVMEVGLDDFREFNVRHPEIMLEVAGQLATRLRETSRRLRDLTFLDVATRLAHTLFELTQRPDANRDSKGVLIRIHRSDLAQLVGCSREMCGRVLKKLEEDGLIISEGRFARVSRGSALRDFRLHKPE